MVIAFAYRVLTLGDRSATWGMRAMGIEFRRADGTRFDFGYALAARGDFHRVRSAVFVLHLVSMAGDPRCPATGRACRTWSFAPRRSTARAIDRPARSSAPGSRNLLLAEPELLLASSQEPAEGNASGAVMRHSLPQSHQFYVTAPQPCPLSGSGKIERKLFTALQGDGAGQPERRALAPGFPPLAKRALPALLLGLLGVPVGAHRGGRLPARPQPARASCAATPTSSGSRPAPGPPTAQYALFRRYLDARHASGGMADMDVHEFAAMIEETPVRSRVVEYHRPAPAATAASWSPCA